MATIAVLGSTGSIGTQTLDVLRAEPGEHEVVALGASSSVELLAEQAQEFRPKVVALANEARAAELKELLPSGTELVAGADALGAVAADADIVINGVVGFAGLPVTLNCLAAGHRLGLANKESLIAAGPVVAQVRSTPGAELVPVDSEHCALHQCLRANESFSADRDSQIAELVVTASGGPFRGRTADELASVSIDDALAHPTWSMGPKITIDSSTLMNKGLEVIEANELFGVGFDRIRVVVHPQSVVHSMVTYTDGSTIAQLSMPDMRLCIAYAISYPDRSQQGHGAIDWTELSRLDFEPPDVEAFRCLALAYEAGRMGETAPAVLSAANEVAVDAFLEGRIAWVDIATVVESVLDRTSVAKADSLEAVLNADEQARVAAREEADRRAR